MAVVGEARIIVRAITAGVGDEIERGLRDGENRANKSGDRIGRRLNDGIRRGTSGRNNAFNNMFDFDKANKTREAWVSLQKAGFNLQTGAGGLVGSLSALVGGLGSLVGSVGNASGALTALAGTFVGVKLGASLAGMALSGVMGAYGKATAATSGLKKSTKDLRDEMRKLKLDAEEAALSEKRAALELEKAREGLLRVQDLAPSNRARREAEQTYAEAQFNLKKAKEDARKAAEEAKKGPKKDKAGTDPYAGLTASQKDFAKVLVTLKPKFDELKEAVASGFLPELGKQIKALMSGKPFEAIKGGFTGIGNALGDVTAKMGGFLTSARGIDNMKAIFGTSEHVVRSLGGALTSAFGSFTDILKAADPMTRRFTSFLESKAKAFDNFLQTKEGKEGLNKFLGEAERVSVQFGGIFGNIFKGIGKIMEANFGPGSGGDILIKGRKKATDSFANLDKMAGGKNRLREYFQNTAENTKAIFSSVGALVKELLKLGEMPEVKQFWDTLKEGAPLMGEILKSGLQAMPALAKLIVNLLKIGEVFADTGAIQVFYNTLNFVAEAIAKVLENEVVKSVLDMISKFAAFALAIGAIAGIAAKVGAIIFATFARFGPVFGPALFIIGAIVAAFMFLYKTNSQVKEQIDALGAAFMTAFGEIAVMAGGMMKELGPILSDSLKILMDALMSLIPIVQDQLMPAFFNLIKTIMPLIPVIVGSLVPAFANIIAAVLPLIPLLISSLLPVIEVLIKNIVPLVAVLIDQLVPVFVTVMAAVAKLVPPIMSLVTSLITALMPAVVLIVNAIVPFVAALAEALIPIIEVLIAVLNPVIEILGFLVGVVANVVAGLATFLIPVITLVIKIFAGFAKFLASVLVPAFNNIGMVFRIVFGALNGFFKGIMNGLITSAEGFINMFIDGINGIFEALNSIKIAVPEALRGFTNGAKEIGFNITPLAKVKFATLAEGGTVMPSPGGTIAQIAEAGRPERVEPLDPDGLSKRDKAMIRELAGGGAGGNINIVVNPSAGMDERELAANISRILAFEIRKGSI